LHTFCTIYILHTPCKTTAVIVGFDRYINYYKIQYAQLCINENKGCEFIATNLDAVTHLTDAQEWAGNGSMVGAIKVCLQTDLVN
jgi:ribonucleotide monophosphatase NagD (HAD superfamily)